MSDEEKILRLAGAVADESPVDWRSESEPGAGGAVLRGLQTIERIGAAYKGLSTLELVTSGSSDTTTMPAVAGPPLAALQSWGRLRILERIDAGGYGEIYRAHDPVLEKTVALKLLLPGPGERSETSSLLDEARRLARVRHPNVLTVHGADVVDGRVGLWTDFIEGETLEERLKRQGPSGPEEAALVGIDLCAALAAMHAAQLVHRDVKTKNVMRAKGGRTVLLDFSAVEDRASDRPGTLTGTLHYMAPELLRGERSGPVSDIYALGVLLYRLVTGRHPIESNDRMELRDKVVRGEWRPLRDVRPDLPPAFAAVIERALARDPADRYPTAGAMERALTATVGVVRDESAVAPRRPRADGAGPASRLWIGLGVGTLVAAGLVVAWLVMGPQPQALSVEAALVRSSPVGDEPLSQGATVAVGDHIALQVTGSRPFHLYVFDQDRNGIIVLHPLPGIGATNPLSARVKHRLPGGGTVARSWVVNTGGGEESILAIASPEPLPQLDEAVRALPKALLGTGEGEKATPGQPEILLRGLGAVVDEPSLGTASRFSDVYLRLYEEASRRKGLWVWQITLHNADPPDAKRK